MSNTNLNWICENISLKLKESSYRNNIFFVILEKGFTDLSGLFYSCPGYRYRLEPTEKKLFDLNLKHDDKWKPGLVIESNRRTSISVHHNHNTDCSCQWINFSKRNLWSAAHSGKSGIDKNTNSSSSSNSTKLVIWNKKVSAWLRPCFDETSTTSAKCWSRC